MTEKQKPLRKPEWIRVQLAAGNKGEKVNKILREGDHVTVCEEANCPNRAECYGCGTATFMIMGDVCTRNCKFCNVAHGKPQPLDINEPNKLAATVAMMKLKYVVVTSVDRDDLSDGGAAHYAATIKAVREKNPETKIEILTPDFRGCMQTALEILSENPADVFNHNLETVPRLFKAITPSCDYQSSLNLLCEHKKLLPNVPTKSGLMVGLGETDEEVLEVLKNLRAHEVDMLTIGQYLQPSHKHVPVERYVTPEKFAEFKQLALKMGFKRVASGPMVRSSYHAEIQV
jgi:lipoic acid synthetase